MSNGFVLFLLVVFALIFGNLNEAYGEDSQKMFNIILFLAKTETYDKYDLTDGITCLNFTEKIRVKHSAGDSDNIEGSISEYTSSGSDCKQLLKASLVSLISYCRNVMGMSTAIASMENDSFSNSLRFRRSLEDPEIHYHHAKRNKGRIFYNFRPSRDKVLITSPEHTEVFKIRSKREYHVANEIAPPTPPPNYGLLGILTASINLTFFGNLLQNNEAEKEESAASQTAQSSGGMQSSSRVGAAGGTSLFTLVKESLDSVADCTSGFLMIVLGGNLAEISDRNTDLVQSVKHVIENTEDNDTLIIVTGACPIVDNERVDQDFSIPVFVRSGPNLNDFTFSSTKLYDIPYAIKSYFTELNTNGGGTYLRRMKRDMAKEQKRNNGRASAFSSLLLVVTSLVYLKLY